MQRRVIVAGYDTFKRASCVPLNSMPSTALHGIQPLELKDTKAYNDNILGVVLTPRPSCTPSRVVALT